MEIEIYFVDLSIEKQQEILDSLNIKSPKEMNWDIFPITTITL